METCVILTNSANQNLPASPTTLTFDTEVVKKGPASQHNNAVNNSRYIAPVDGRYYVTAAFHDVRAGGTSLQIQKNGSGATLEYQNAETFPGTNDVYPQIARLIDLLAGEYIELVIYGLVNPAGAQTKDVALPYFSVSLQPS